MFGIRIVAQCDPFTDEPTGDWVIYQTHAISGYGIYRVLRKHSTNFLALPTAQFGGLEISTLTGNKYQWRGDTKVRAIGPDGYIGGWVN